MHYGTQERHDCIKNNQKGKKMTDLGFILDIAIIILLIPTIAYAYKLNKNLIVLRKNQGNLTLLIQSLTEAAAKAEAVIPKLKSAAANAAEELKNAADDAKKNKEEMDFVADRAKNLAGRLENVIYASRYPSDNGKKNEPKATCKDIDFKDDPSEAEAELLRALRSIK
jgi:hypothetical protein